MDFADALDDERTKPDPRAGCNIKRLLEDVTPKERDAIIAALRDLSIGHAKIVRALNASGHAIGYSVVQRHRMTPDDGGCQCPASTKP